MFCRYGDPAGWGIPVPGLPLEAAPVGERPPVAEPVEEWLLIPAAQWAAPGGAAAGELQSKPAAPRLPMAERRAAAVEAAELERDRRLHGLHALRVIPLSPVIPALRVSPVTPGPRALPVLHAPRALP